jgi:hypothetical protein
MSYASVYTHVPGAIVACIRGLIVTCWTCASIRISTAPLRCIIPQISGFSVSSVPHPRVPWSRRRRLSRPFLRPHPACPCGLPPCRPRHMLPRLFRWASAAWKQGLDATDRLAEAPQRESECCGKLPIRPVESHAIPAQYPHPQGRRMTSKDGVRQIVDASLTGLA